MCNGLLCPLMVGICFRVTLIDPCHGRESTGVTNINNARSLSQHAQCHAAMINVINYTCLSAMKMVYSVNPLLIFLS